MADVDELEVGNDWPRDREGVEPAVPMLICPCGGHVDPDMENIHCETCGRTFNERGTRVISEYDFDDEGNLVPITTGMEP